MTAEPVALSNRQKRARRKAKPSAPRALKSAGQTVTPPLKDDGGLSMSDRDGLKWLIGRNRLTAQQTKEALAYRRDYRASAADGVDLKSCLDIRVRGTKREADGPANAIISDMDARQRLFLKRHVVLCGQADLLEVLDGVCGRGVTLRELAGGKSYVANAYEMVLKIALDMLAKAEVAPPSKAA